MLDLKFIRDNINLVRVAMANRHDAPPLDEILQLDGERRQKIIELEDLRHERKEASKERKTDKASTEEGRDLRTMIRSLEDEVRNLELQLQDLLLQVPNIPHSSTPIGKDENDNIVIRSWREPIKFDFKPKPH